MCWKDILERAFTNTRKYPLMYVAVVVILTGIEDKKQALEQLVEWKSNSETALKQR